jgi:hypothetical protein
MSQPVLSDLFFDHVHPNNDGYDLMADVFFRAITTARGTAVASGMAAPSALLWSSPGLSRGGHALARKKHLLER